MSTARKTLTRLTAVAVTALTALNVGIIAPAQPASAASFVPISGSGSSWSYPAIHLWIHNVVQDQITVNYNPSGSAQGRADFKSGLADFGASEIPYGVQDGSSVDPPPTRGYAYMPDTAGGVALMYNLSIGGKRVTSLRLSGAVIAGIFTNQITAWNDPRIAADNPGLALPARTIVPVVRTDADGGTVVFTQWMLATDPSAWQAYCTATGRSPCTQTATYPVQSGTNMIGVPQDAGVAGYVSQTASNGAIGYVASSYALATGFPVAKVLNAAGYYTAPTADNVGVSLLHAQVNMDPTSPLYLTADLSQVYTDTDPRTYELSYYSYLIIPTDLTDGMTTDKGYTLGAFGQYLLCQGQQQVNLLGYAALPLNLAEAGFTQLQKIPGASLPATTAAFIASCNNPTFAPDGTNTLANSAPLPSPCDQQGANRCVTSGISLAAAIPVSGAFTLTVDTSDTITLVVSGNTATAATTPIIVSDTRNTFPGWSVLGQAADFTGSGTAAGVSISGNQLGWVPTASSFGAGVTLGGTVAPAAPGLGTTAAVLASAPAGVGSGFGTSTLGANLTLAITPQTLAGGYTGSLTVTAVTAAP
jgi:ABC-type phosphate transport system substrate-binding protein